MIAADEGGQWQKSSYVEQSSSETHLGLIGAGLAGISKGGSKSQEKDMKDKKKKRKLKR